MKNESCPILNSHDASYCKEKCSFYNADTDECKMYEMRQCLNEFDILLSEIKKSINKADDL